MNFCGNFLRANLDWDWIIVNEAIYLFYALDSGKTGARNLELLYVI